MRITIKVVFGILGCLTWISTPAVGEDFPHHTSADFQLEIRATNAINPVGSDIPLEAHLRNISTTEANIRHRDSGRAEDDYVITMTPINGKPLVKTRYYKRVLGEPVEPLPNEGPLHGSGYGDLIKPGEVDVETTKLNNLFELIIPGVYFLTAKRTDPDVPGVIHSNYIEITVSPAAQ